MESLTGAEGQRDHVIDLDGVAQIEAGAGALQAGIVGVEERAEAGGAISRTVSEYLTVSVVSLKLYAARGSFTHFELERIVGGVTVVS